MPSFPRVVRSSVSFEMSAAIVRPPLIEKAVRQTPLIARSSQVSKEFLQIGIAGAVHCSAAVAHDARVRRNDAITIEDDAAPRRDRTVPAEAAGELRVIVADGRATDEDRVVFLAELQAFLPRRIGRDPLAVTLDGCELPIERHARLE